MGDMTTASITARTSSQTEAHLEQLIAAHLPEASPKQARYLVANIGAAREAALKAIAELTEFVAAVDGTDEVFHQLRMHGSQTICSNTAAGYVAEVTARSAAAAAIISVLL